MRDATEACRGARVAPAQICAWLLTAGPDEFAIVEWSPSIPEVPAILTAAERDVAIRLLSGQSNADIARARGTSVRTVANQAASIYRKLGVGSRVGLQAWGATTLPARR